MDTGRTVLITGAAGGIGTQLVRRFLDNGDTVVAVDGDQGALERLVDDLDPGSQVVTHVADVIDETAVGGVAESLGALGNGLDVLITCHGYFPNIPFEELSSERWRHVVDVNLTGTFLVISELLPLMKGREWGRIVTIGSGSVFKGTAGFSAYVAAKAGVIGLSRTLAREVGEYGITVNTVTPGLTTTPVVLESFSAETLAAQQSRRAIAREQRAEDLVGTVFFLASSGADFITGQTVNVDGGSHFH